MYATQSVDSITSGFPQPPNSILTIRGKPTQKTLDEVLKPLVANAASVHTLLGGGNHGFAAIRMSAARYNGIPNTVPFIKPLSPGEYTLDTSIKNAAQREERQHEYNLRVQKFMIYKNLEQACKNIFLTCIPPECYLKLKIDPTGYNGVSLYTLIKHVYAKHGKITLKMKNENEALMKSDFSIETNTLEELQANSRQNRWQLQCEDHHLRRWRSQ